MARLLEIKTIIMNVYKRFDKIIDPLLKFMICLFAIIGVNKFFGFALVLNKFYVNVGIALVGAFTPASWFVLLLLVVTSVQLFSFSIEVSIIVTLAMIIAYCLFARIQPKYAIFIILVPILYQLKLVYIVPLLAGLFFTPASIIPISVGVMVHHFAGYMQGLYDLASEGLDLFSMPDTLLNMNKYLMETILQDREMFLTIGIFAVVIVVMHFVKQLEYAYIHYVTIAAGGITLLLGLIIGFAIGNVQANYFGIIIGAILCTLIVGVIQFFRFTLDYNRMEKVQYEDDDYYYYVKAVPKMKMQQQKKEIVKIQ